VKSIARERPSNYEADGHAAYARRLAGYMNDAGYIRALTIREYGIAPGVHRIQEWIDKRHRDAAAIKRVVQNRHRIDPAANDGDDFKVVRLDLPKPTPKPRIRRKAVAFVPPAKVRPPVRLSRRVIDAVAEWFGLEPQDILGKSRAHHKVSARFVAIRILREMRFASGEHRFSFPDIGRVLEGRDHSTIIYAWNTFDDRARKYPEMREAYEDLRHLAEGWQA
jgi:chromosomal replication initiator protein